MPADLASRDDRIVIHDRSGNSLPFSRGIMATSLLATGIPTEDAYRLASAVQLRLLETDTNDLDAESLVAFTMRCSARSLVGSRSPNAGNRGAERSDLADRW